MTAEIETITAILNANHDFLVGENDLDKTAQEWVGLDLAGWLAADVFQAVIARRFEAAGVTPAEVEALEGWQVGDDECARVGYAVANGDIRVEKAVAAVRKARAA